MREPVAVSVRIENCYAEAFGQAVLRAGIEKRVTWHTLRHTWASWMIQVGIRDTKLMRLGNWRTLAMMQNYAHLDEASLAEAAARLAASFSARTASAAGDSERAA